MLYLNKHVFAPAFLAQATFDAYGKDDTDAAADAAKIFGGGCGTALPLFRR